MFTNYKNDENSIDNTFNIDDYTNIILELLQTPNKTITEKTKITNEINLSLSFIDSEINKLNAKKEFFEDIRNEFNQQNTLDNNIQEEEYKQQKENTIITNPTISNNVYNNIYTTIKGKYLKFIFYLNNKIK
jgi:hypothetical protein